MYFAQARHYYQGRTKKVRCLTIHTMECPEAGGRARWCINWFASLAAPVASTHYAVDATEAVQGVRESDTAFCTPGVNADGISIEHAGFAKQGPGDWADDYSQAMLRISAKLAAEVCARNDIPIKHLSDAELKAGERGIIGHIQATNVYKLSSHWDPGDSFPWDQYIDLVRGFAEPKPSRSETRTPPKGGIAEDGVWGPATTKALQVHFGTPADGVISSQPDYGFPIQGLKTAKNPKGSQLVAAIQKAVKCKADGCLGPATVKAIQKYLGTTVDGKISDPSLMVTAMQKRLNGGKF